MIDKIDSENFKKKIFQEISKVPFGSLPKKEIELIILDAIVSSLEPEGRYDKIDKHFLSLQRYFKLTRIQLSNKILDAQLRYDQKTDKDVVDFILSNLYQKNFVAENEFIIFSIFNPLLNDTIKSYFESKGLISDTSFNKLIFKINLNGLIQFISQLENFDERLKHQLNIIINDSLELGLINNKPKKSAIEKVESISVIGSNLINVLDKLSPIIQNLFL